MTKLPAKPNSLKMFEGNNIRSVWNEKEEKWYFSVVDVVRALTDSPNPRDYFKKMRKRDKELDGYVGTNCPHVEMSTHTGKIRSTLAANPEQLLRIIQSIPSPKAEPFKLWLARVGSERIDEIQNPELAVARMRRIYAEKGYSESWIQQRERAIASRNKLTDEWKTRGAKEGRDFAILTNEIYKTGFGLDAKSYKNLKGVEKKHNLRDSMTEMELALTNLGETTARELHWNNDSYGIGELREDTHKAGQVTKKARKEAEKYLEKPIVTDELPQGAAKRIKNGTM